MLQTSSNLVELRHPIVVSAIGGFSTPRYPNVPGLKEYKGKVVHVSRWPAEWEDAKSLRGKEIMVVGNGCSGYVDQADKARSSVGAYMSVCSSSLAWRKSRTSK
jgi:4-hydroxyacetophenone monooxygenase